MTRYGQQPPKFEDTSDDASLSSVELAPMTSLIEDSLTDAKLLTPGAGAGLADLEGGGDVPPAIAEISPATSDTRSLPRLRLHKVGNWVALISLAFEALQLSMVAIQSATQSRVQSEQPVELGFFDRDVVPAIFLSAESWIPADSDVAVHLIYSYGGIACSVVLVAMFVYQFLRELRRFGNFKNREQNQKAANDCFFYSFVGSIIYGHGDIKNISRGMSVAVSLLSDVLFIIVTQKLMLVLTCEYPTGGDSPPFLKIDPDILCWEGEHTRLASASLVAFSYYLPLSTMIAPMFAEAPAPDGSRSKDISFAKPFLSIITVSKCILLVAITFFSNQDIVASVSISFVVSFALTMVTLVWHQFAQPDEDISVPSGSTQVCFAFSVPLSFTLSSS